MARAVISPEERDELKRLYRALAGAHDHCSAVLRDHGMESAEFFAAHEAEGAIIRQIKEIQGTTGKHWMAS